jgi:hypothetical protein
MWTPAEAQYHPNQRLVYCDQTPPPIMPHVYPPFNHFQYDSSSIGFHFHHQPFHPDYDERYSRIQPHVMQSQALHQSYQHPQYSRRFECVDWSTPAMKYGAKIDKMMYSKIETEKRGTKRIRSADRNRLIILSSEKVFPGISAELRIWRDDIYHVFYDCSCGSRRPSHDKKSIIAHIERTHSGQSSRALKVRRK